MMSIQSYLVTSVWSYYALIALGLCTLYGANVNANVIFVIITTVIHSFIAYQASRHFLVDASSGQYSFLGPKQQTFKTLTSLLEYYKYDDDNSGLVQYNT